MRSVTTLILLINTAFCASAAVAGDYYGKLQASTRFNWSGLYIGAGLGAARSKLSVTDVESYAALSSPGVTTQIDHTGVLGSAQVGYNWMFGQLLLGMEVDGGYMNLDGDALLTRTVSGTRAGLSGGAYGDVTARLGWSFGTTLVYLKGGWAYLNASDAFSTVTGSFSRKTDINSFTGWTAGGGVGYALNSNWSTKIEFQHYDFGDKAQIIFNSVQDGKVPFDIRNQLTVDTLQVGLAYHF